MNALRLPRRYRTVWLSDIHLGCRMAQPEALLAFLRGMECDTLYLVGDVIDGWKFGRGWRWSAAQTEILQDVLARAGGGTRVVLIPGNHDPLFRRFLGLDIGGVQIRDEVVHRTADGRRLWVLHGDAYDGLGHHPRWQTWLADIAYQMAVSLNRAINGLRRRMGKSPWSLVNTIKTRLPKSARFIRRFEHTVAAAAAARGLDGVVCGHIHLAALKPVCGVLYANDGDWVESCSALVEHGDGRLELVDAAAAGTAPAPRFAYASPG